MSMKNLLISLLLCVAFMACKKNTIDPPPDAGSASYKIKTMTSLDGTSTFTYYWAGGKCIKADFHTTNSGGETSSTSYSLNSSYLIGTTSGDINEIDTIGIVDGNGNLIAMWSNSTTSTKQIWDTIHINYNSNQQIMGIQDIYISKDLSSSVVSKYTYNTSYAYTNDLPTSYSYTSDNTGDAAGNGTLSYYDTLDAVGFNSLVCVGGNNQSQLWYEGFMSISGPVVLSRLGKPLPRVFKQQISVSPVEIFSKQTYTIDGYNRITKDSGYNYTY